MLRSGSHPFGPERRPLASVRQFVGGGLAAVALTGAGYAAAQVFPADAPRPAPIVRTAPVLCAEDDPCWDCQHMGNRICGPTTTLPTITR